MRNYSGSWKHKPPIFYVIVLVAIGVAVIAIWRQYHPYDYIVWDALIVVFAVSVIVTCLYFVRDWWVDGKERNQLFQQQLQQPTPPPNIAPTKIYEQKQRVVARCPVKQLPPMNRRPFLGIGGSQTARQEISDNQTVSANTQKQTDRQKVLLYRQTYPNAGLREIAAGVGFGKDKVAGIIRELDQGAH